jgi:hypothetical protein
MLAFAISSFSSVVWVIVAILMIDLAKYSARLLRLLRLIFLLSHPSGRVSVPLLEFLAQPFYGYQPCVYTGRINGIFKDALHSLELERDLVGPGQKGLPQLVSCPIAFGRADPSPSSGLALLA